MKIYRQIMIYGRLKLHWQLRDGTGSLVQAVICHQRKTLSIIEIWTPILSKFVKFLRLMFSYFYRGLALGEMFGNSKSSEELFW